MLDQNDKLEGPLVKALLDILMPHILERLEEKKKDVVEEPVVSEPELSGKRGSIVLTNQDHLRGFMYAKFDGLPAWIVSTQTGLSTRTILRLREELPALYAPYNESTLKKIGYLK